MSADGTRRTLDLGISDVHIPSAMGARRKRMAKLPTKRPAGKPGAAKTKGRGGKTPPAMAAAAPPLRRGKRIHVTADLGHGGSLSVRHLTDETVALDGVGVALSDDGDDKPVWIQLAKPGVFRGHSAGPFELNDKVFQEIVRNFYSTQNQAIPIDFEHASEADATEGTIPTMGAPAQGWIRELKIEDGNLWGLVEWGDRAREYIRSGAYKFFSPAIRFGAKDRVSGQNIGARMTSGALTNNPFLDGMRPLAARDAADAAGEVLTTLRAGPFAHQPHEYMPALKSALRLGELATARECADQLGRLRGQYDLCGGIGMTADGVDLGAYMHPLRALVGAAPGFTWEQVFDIVEDLIDAAIDEHEVEFHPDAAPTDGEASMDDDGDGAQMRDQATQDQPPGDSPATNSETSDMDKTIELSTQLAETKLALKDAEAKTAAADVKLKDAEAKAQAAEVKAAELSLALKDAQAAAATAEAGLAAKDEEIKQLRDAQAKREDDDRRARVQLAFDTYKDARKLTDDDKEAMLIVLSSKPETFERQYPIVAPNQQHLLANLTDNREATTPKTTEDPAPVIDIRIAARKLSAERGIPLAQAQALLARGRSAKKA